MTMVTTNADTLRLFRVCYAAMNLVSLDARQTSKQDTHWLDRFLGRSERSDQSRSERNTTSNRVVKGSSPLFRKTWKRNASNIYGGHSYLKSSAYRAQPNKKPTICTNMSDVGPDRKTYNFFICPQAHNLSDFEWCCRTLGREECCQREQSGSEKHSRVTSTKEALMVFFVVFGGHILMALLIYCCIRSGRHQKCSWSCGHCKKSGTINQSETSEDVSSIPLNQSAASRQSTLNSSDVHLCATLMGGYGPAGSVNSETSYTDRLEMTRLAASDLDLSRETTESGPTQALVSLEWRDDTLQEFPPAYCTLEEQTSPTHTLQQQQMTSVTLLLPRCHSSSVCESPPHYSMLLSEALQEDNWLEYGLVRADENPWILAGHSSSRTLMSSGYDMIPGSSDNPQTRQTSTRIWGDPPPAYDSDVS